jgi:hypothetical protein
MQKTQIRRRNYFMRRLTKLPRKLKTIALGAGVASLLLGGAPTYAEKSEYTYNGTQTSGNYTDPAYSGTGSQATTANPGTYVTLSTTGSEWFSSFVGSGVSGLWKSATPDGNRLIVSYSSGSVPDFFFGGVADYLSTDSVVGNEVHYTGYTSGSAKILAGGVSHYGSASGNKVFYYSGGLSGLPFSSESYAIIGGAAIGDGTATAEHPHANNNEVVVAGSDNITGKVIGGLVIDENSHDSEVNNNTVTIDSTYTGIITGDVIGGAVNPAAASDHSTATVSGNQVIINGGTVNGSIYGNYSSAGAADGKNKDGVIAVDITGGSVTGSVRGGASYNDHGSAVKDNTVRLSGSARVVGEVYGGETVGDGDVTGNRVEIKDSASVVSAFVYGGYANGAGNVTDNSVSWLSTAGAKAVFGGLAQDGTATGNSVDYQGGNLTGFTGFGSNYAIIGGVSYSGGKAEKNTVNVVSAVASTTFVGGIVGGAALSGGDATENKIGISLSGSGTLKIGEYTSNKEAHIVGGIAQGSNNATGNTVSLKGSDSNKIEVYGIVAGGETIGTGTAGGNTVQLENVDVKEVSDGSGGTVHGSVFGNRSYNGSAVGRGDDANPDVHIKGGTIAGNVFGGIVFNSTGTSEAKNHRVVITDATVNGSVYGGEVQEYSGANGDANGNKVTLDNVTTANVYGGRVSGTAIGGDANDNYVTINGGTVSQDVFGGFVDEDGDASGNIVTLKNAVVKDVYGGRVDGTGTTNSASNNHITIDGGMVNGQYIFGGELWYSASGNNTASNNSITLTGSISLTTNYLFGYNGTNVTTHEGNTLNIYNLVQSGGAIANVGNFEIYDFKIDRANAINGSFALTATTVTMDDATIKGIEITGGGDKLPNDAVVGLIEATSSFSSSKYDPTDLGYNPNDATVTGRQGVSTLYDFDVTLDSNKLTATVKSSKANPATKSLSEGWLSGPAFLNQGADLLEKEAVKAAGVEAWREQGPAVFAAMGYGDTRHNTGSHVDVKGPSLVVGLASAKETAKGTRLTYGGFIEAGWGSYDSYNSFSGIGEVRGEGDTSYYGLGILARADHAKHGTGRLYTEGSLRVGQVKTDFTSDLGAPGTSAYYNAKAVYYGLHLGVGYIRELKGDASLDLYTKLLYTRTGSDSLNVSGDPVELDAVSSVRWRAGARYVKAVGNRNEFYAGLAYDHEFDGKAKGTANGSAIAVPDLKGGTGIGELGVVFKGKNSLVDIKLEGYTGKREGFGFGAQFKWFF